MRRAGGAPRGLPAPPDRRRPSRRDLRADRGSGRGPQARLQVGGRPRGGSAGDARHDHRGTAARAGGRELADGIGPRSRRRGRVVLRTGRRRYLHRCFRRERGHGGGARRRNRPRRPSRDRGAGRACRPTRGGQGARRRSRAGHPHRPRAGLGRAEAARLVWPRNARRARPLVTGGGRRRGDGGVLPRPHAMRRPAQARPAGFGPRRGGDGDRCLHPCQPRAHAHPLRIARGLAPRRHRPLRHAGRLAPALRPPVEPADRPRRDRGAARRRRMAARGPRHARGPAYRARSRTRSLAGAGAAGAGPRRPTRPRRDRRRPPGGASRCRLASRRRLPSDTAARRAARGPRTRCGAGRQIGRTPRHAARRHPALATPRWRLRAGRRRFRTRRHARPARPQSRHHRRAPGHLLRAGRHQTTQDQAQQPARLFRGGACDRRRGIHEAAAVDHLPSSPEHG